MAPKPHYDDEDVVVWKVKRGLYKLTMLGVIG